MKREAVERGLAALGGFSLSNREWAERGIGVKPNGEKRTAADVLSVPNAELSIVERAMVERPEGWTEGGRPVAGDADEPLPALGRESVEVSVKYAKYLERQEKEVQRMRQNREARIPDAFDYSSLPCLSAEEVEKLSAARPGTIREASDIPGITPKAMLYLFNELQQGKMRKAAAAGRQRHSQRSAAAAIAKDATHASAPARGLGPVEGVPPTRPSWPTARPRASSSSD
jgi:tRNA uridine 5-carboxymethylaminomethyl modification enzyme